MSVQLLWKAWQGIALILALCQSWPWKNISLAVFTYCRILVKDLPPHLPCKESRVFDLSFAGVTPSAVCRRCGGTLSHSRCSGAPAAKIQGWGSIFNLVSVPSQLYVAALTKCGWRRDLFSEMFASPWAPSKPGKNMWSQGIWDLLGELLKGARDSVITWETWAALEIQSSAPSLYLSSPTGPAPLGSFIFALMAALDNGAAEKSPKSKGSTPDASGPPFPACIRVQLEMGIGPFAAFRPELLSISELLFKGRLHRPRLRADAAPKMTIIHAL